MSVTPIIAEVLNVNYMRGSDLTLSVLRNVFKTPAMRISQKLTGVGRYINGSISYIFQYGDEDSDELAEWLAFKYLVETCQQGGVGCLFWDTLENRLRNEIIGTWDGSTLDFQLMMKTIVAGYTVTRKVTRPIHNFGTGGAPDRLQVDGLYDPADSLIGLANTISIKIGASIGTASAETSFTVDETTGVLTFSGGLTHTNGHNIYASGFTLWPIMFQDPSLPWSADGPTIDVNPLRIQEIPQDF